MALAASLDDAAADTALVAFHWLDTTAHELVRSRDLLHAVTKSAAMITSLDNDSSVASAPNENLAREVLELHTLGVEGPYSEADVREPAQCLTGGTYVQDQGRPDFGAFHLDVAVHDFGAKQVLGLTLPASAPWSRPRFRRPFDFATALYRATGAALDEPVRLLAALAPLGQTPFPSYQFH